MSTAKQTAMRPAEKAPAPPASSAQSAAATSATGEVAAKPKSPASTCDATRKLTGKARMAGKGKTQRSSSWRLDSKGQTATDEVIRSQSKSFKQKHLFVCLSKRFLFRARRRGDYRPLVCIAHRAINQFARVTRARNL